MFNPIVFAVVNVAFCFAAIMVTITVTGGDAVLWSAFALFKLVGVM